MVRWRWLRATTAMAGSALLLGGAAEAADIIPPMIPPPDAVGGLPAVSAVNGKIAAFGVAFREETGGGVVGSLSLPLTERFGAQFDGLYGEAGDAAFYGVAGHLFWRDPSVALVGLYASYAESDVADPIDFSTTIDGEVGKVGAEAELYLGRLSLLGLAAWQYGTVEGFAGKARLAYYATDNLRLDAGVRYAENIGTIGEFGGVWQIAGTALALFGEGGIGIDNEDFYYGQGGVRFYLAPEQKTLIRRDREDDPEAELPHDLFTAIGDGPCPADQHITNGFCDGNL